MVERHKKLAFYGVPSTGTAGYVLTRMRFFTQLAQNKNAIEHSVKYVDEASKRNNVVGYDPSIAYAFDDTRNDPVLDDIKNITTKELTGDLAERFILLVDTVSNEATLRKYSVIPNTEGDDADFYGYSGSFKACGELTSGTAEVASNGMSATFTPEGAVSVGD